MMTLLNATTVGVTALMYLIFIGVSVLIAYRHAKGAPFWKKVRASKWLEQLNNKVLSKILAYKKSFKAKEEIINKEHNAQAKKEVQADTQHRKQDNIKAERSIADSKAREKVAIANISRKETEAATTVSAAYKSSSRNTTVRFGAVDFSNFGKKFGNMIAMIGMFFMLFMLNACTTDQVLHIDVLLHDNSQSIESFGAYITPQQLAAEVIPYEKESEEVYPNGQQIVIGKISDLSSDNKVTLNLPVAGHFLMVDEHGRKKEMKQYYNDVEEAFEQALNVKAKRPQSYINRSIQSIADVFDESGGVLYLLTDLASENAYSVSLPRYLNRYGSDLMKHYDTIAAQMYRDAPYDFRSDVTVNVIYKPQPDEDEAYRLYSAYWDRYLRERGCKEVNFLTNL